MTLVAAWFLKASTLPTSIVPIVVFVGHKLSVLAAIAILGRPGFDYLKGLVIGGLKAERLRPRMGEDR